MILYMGLGRMGLPMANHARRAGQDVIGFDPSAERRAMFAAGGGAAVPDFDTHLLQADAVVIMVGSQSQVEAIVAGEGGVMQRCAPGTLVLVVSTVAPQFIADLGQRVAAKGIRLVDAPVCRAEMGAVQGSLLTFLSGSEADCREAAELMRPYSADVEVVGTRLGAAQVAKTVNNMILWACAVANEEGLKLAASWQLDTEALRRALVTSSADNWCLRNWDRIGEMPWSIKDMDIALETAGENAITVPLGEAVSRLVRISSVLSHAA